MDDRRTFPNVPTSVGHARRYVAEVLRKLDPETIANAALLVSELATNSLCHAGTPFTIEVGVAGDVVMIVVSDSGPGLPTIRTPVPDEPTGRGLQIIEALSLSWGVARTPSCIGKRVWFTLPVAMP